MGSRKGKVLRVKLCGGMAMSSYKDYKKKALQNPESIFFVRNCQKQGKGNRWNND